MKTQETWKYIHSERMQMAETLDSLSPGQWDVASWCEGWSIRDVVGHIVAAAEQTPLNFYRELMSAGFKFDVFTQRGASRLAQNDPVELIRRLRARTTTTNHPPAPVMAMLGEIIVHGEDIRRPLGLIHRSPEAALVAVADSWKNTNLLIGSKRRISGVELRANEVDWRHGTGPLVSGPLQSLILAMTGRKGSHQDLSGEGLSILERRP